MQRPVLAIISPSRDAYSETFVQAHRRLIDADIRFYYKGTLPLSLDGYGTLRTEALAALCRQRLRRRIAYPHLNIDELCLRDSLVREQVQVVLAEYGTTAAAVLPVCRDLALPMIVHFHGFDASVCEVVDRYQEQYKAVFGYASHVIAVSRVMEERLLELGCPREKLIYNVYGPDEALLAIEPADPPARRFLAVGRFVDKKAPHNTLLSFRKALERFPDAELIIAGTGPLMSVCKDLIKYFDMQRSVTLAGVLTPEQVREQFSECMAFVQHSVTALDGDMEGTPVAVLEASAAALPVIATRHAGIPDVVIHGETGLLVEEHDVDGMAMCMCEILENPVKAKTMGQAGRQRIREQFTMARHIDILNNCVMRSAAGSTVTIESSG
jgi:colanic acid/amylovoran biosynthesis glycosyltransferase